LNRITNTRWITNGIIQTVGALLGKEGRVEVRTRRDKQDLKVAPDAVVAAVRDLARRLGESV